MHADLTSANPNIERPVALAVLGLGAFTVGTSELVVVGILDQIADAAGISISTAGTLVTAYALGIALGGPLLTALTRALRSAPDAPDPAAGLAGSGRAGRAISIVSAALPCRR